jgi:MHS family alpha-ketoglutarate permease-like MFS transporter
LVEPQSSKHAQEQAKQDGPKSEAIELFSKHPQAAFTVIMLTAEGRLPLTPSPPIYKNTATEITTAAICIFMLIQPAVGALSDKIGRKPIMIAFGICGVLFNVPIFNRLGTTTDATAAFWLCMSGIIIVTGYTSIHAVVKAELDPPHIHALGVALSYAIANPIFGGTVELVALSFKNTRHESDFFYCITFLIGLSLITYVLIKDTKKHSLITDQ